MKILFVHNFYSSSLPSGENQVVLAERNLLTKFGHDLSEFYRSNDEIKYSGLKGKVRGALSTPWNPSTSRSVQTLAKEFCPDVMHVHNTFPLISPAIFSSVRFNTAKVLTLHNYRLFCPAALPIRNGNICTECIERNTVFPSLLHGCYKDSRIATAPVAMSVALHKALGTWAHHVDAFICLSEFQRKLMVAAGLPYEKVHVKPNFYPGNPLVIPWNDRKPYVVFVGRLSIEKGVRTLVKAWKIWGAEAPELRFVGDGELKSELQALAAGLPVHFLGMLPSKLAEKQIAEASLLILPSECFEGFPMVIREAFAFGTPVAVSSLGPLPLIVENNVSGVLFEAANPGSLMHTVRSAWGDQGLLKRLGEGARFEFEQKYTEDANYKTLMSIYNQAILESRRGLKR